MKPQTSPKAFIIFSLIGLGNTVFDLVLYVVLFNGTHSILLANIGATSAALIGSYLLNAKLTFRAKRWTRRSFLGFVAVTLFGLWVLQTAAIYALNPIVRHIPESLWQLSGPFEHTARTVLPKLLATVVTFIWNFVWYNKVIFKDNALERSEALAAEVL